MMTLRKSISHRLIVSASKLMNFGRGGSISTKDYAVISFINPPTPHGEHF